MQVPESDGSDSRRCSKGALNCRLEEHDMRSKPGELSREDLVALLAACEEVKDISGWCTVIQRARV